MSLGSRLLKNAITMGWRLTRHRKVNLEKTRRDINFWARLMPPVFGVKQHSTNIHGIKAEWVIPWLSKNDRVMLYLHGGAFAMCSIRTHRRLVSLIAKEAGVKALLIDYCLAPEDVYPAALDQACKVYEWLLESGYKPENITIGGDSAGGGLAVAALLKLRDMGRPLPRAAILLSPWTDLESNGDAYEKAEQQGYINKDSIRLYGKLYAGDHDIRHPYVSPVYGDFTALPPMLIQVSAEELLYEDSARLYAKAKVDGVEVRLEPWRGMVHVWHVYDFIVPEGKKAIRQLGKYLKEQMSKPVPKAARKIKAA